MPKSAKAAKTIEVTDEKSAEIFRLLVQDGKAFTFIPGMPSRKAAAEIEPAPEGGNNPLGLPAPAGALPVPDRVQTLVLAAPEEDSDIIEDLALPDDEVFDERGIAGRHSDTQLQTRFTPEGLQKRLLDLYFDARTLEDEQGVNVLFLTLGALRWVDPNDKTNIRRAPLILIPVSLERGTAGERFKLRARPEDFATNLSLEIFLDRLHGIRLPDVDVGESFDFDAYLDIVEKSVDAKEGWGVERDVVVLGFFSFAKFMMYRDLDPATWPKDSAITGRPLLKGLLADGFERGEPLYPDDEPIDPIIPPSELLHILDSDSSQTLAVHEVRMGRNLVIQGPPGTGKSQTIANLVAAAVADGKKVLFVAEKMAALEVVKRRLDAKGVGVACLELHSHKANKKAVLEDIRRTWENGAPRVADIGSLNARLGDARDELNAHAARMHKRHPASGLSPFQVIGQLVRLRAAGEQPNDIDLDAPESWSRDGYDDRHKVLRELADRVTDIGVPSGHVWHGVKRSSITPMEVERLSSRLSAAASDSAALEEHVSALAAFLHADAPTTWEQVEPLLDLAKRLVSAPLAPEAFAAPEWRDARSELQAIVRHGEVYAAARNTLEGHVTEAAWTAATEEDCGILVMLRPETSQADLESIAALKAGLPDLIEGARLLSAHFGEPEPRTVRDIATLARVGQRLFEAPAAPAAALADPVWDQGTAAQRDALSALTEVQAARRDLQGKLQDTAWETSLTEARNVLASHGTGMFRKLSGEWRRANRLARSCLANPDQPLEATLSQLDRLQQAKAALAALATEDAVAKAAFGTAWRGERSDAALIEAVITWMEGHGDVARTVRRIAGRDADRDVTARYMVRLADATEAEKRAAAFGSVTLSSAEDLAAPEVLGKAEAVTSSDQATRSLFVKLPGTMGERQALLDRLRAGQAAARQIEDAASLGAGAFGSKWSGKTSPWDELRGALRWADENTDILAAAGAVTERASAARTANQLALASSRLGEAVEKIAAELELDLVAAFGGDLAQVALSAVTGKLAIWSVSGEHLFQWTAYRDRAERGRALGCGVIVDRLTTGRLSPDRTLPAFEMAYFEALYLDITKAEPELARFDGELHSRKVAEFAELDQRRIHVSADEIVRAHHQRIPPRDGGAIGPLGVLRNELQKKRGHMPIRKLVERAGPALQAMKPVFMMSPLSVAQFLAPGVAEFDLLVMDEASQIQPVDALGAVARAKQVVVVGDPRQLPPTSFFARMTSGDDADEDEGGRVTDIESILGLFTARGLPMRMLRWHYRSRHQSLIAVSNRQFYDSKLFVVPSPYTAEAGMGLRFHHITDGVFDSGGKRHNFVEARVVARAIIDHALNTPELSLGVAAFSVAQRRAILDELELLRRAHPETEGFFHSHPSEPFFVKNLENVQGDERDVIFISVAYGPTTPGGRVPMRFGPLGSEGGERRLNVLISRAKQRCEVFSSMTDEDIDPDFAQSRKGVFAFRMFLQFARTGRLSMAEATGRDHDSVFEEQVANALQARGYHVHRQVGLAGFFIDLAISDPERPGRYLLGIECDGAAYHDALSARDRDRLRQSVLESQNWKIHRIWGSDWFQRPEQELERVFAAIETAKLDDAERTTRRTAPVFRITEEDQGDSILLTIETGAEDTAVRANAFPIYEEAIVERASHLICELHEVPRGILVGYVEQIAATEGPVHLDEVVTRIREAWGLQRAGARIRDAVTGAVDVALRKGTVLRDGEFLTALGRDAALRDRSGDVSPGLRKAEMISLDEIAAGALKIVERNFGAKSDQLVTEVSRAMGFKATSAAMRRRVEDGIDLALSQGGLVEREGLLQMAPLSRSDWED